MKLPSGFWWTLAHVVVFVLQRWFRNEYFRDGFDDAVKKGGANVDARLKRAADARAAHDALVGGDPNKLQNDPNRRSD